MKELSIEQKAKRYDEAFTKARNIVNSINVGLIGKDSFEAVFPELKESEDEQIRKALIEHIKSMFDGCCTKWSYKERDLILAWLEKQGEPTEINPTEFDTRLQNLIGQFDSLPKEELIGSLSFWLNVVQNNGTYKEEKQGEQESVWSEEDEKYILNIIHFLEHPTLLGKSNKHIAIEMIDWLKSLKDRVQPQPKQEWSKEDENIILRLIDYLYGKSRLAKDREDGIAWLKSLRPQNRWKPSDEQITWLYRAAEDANKDSRMKQILNELLFDLEKLKG